MPYSRAQWVVAWIVCCSNNSFAIVQEIKIADQQESDQQKLKKAFDSVAGKLNEIDSDELQGILNYIFSKGLCYYLLKFMIWEKITNRPQDIR